MSDLQAIGEEVLAVARDMSGQAQSLLGIAQRLKMAASQAAASGRGAPDGGRAAAQTAAALQSAAEHCGRAAQLLAAGKAVAERFVVTNVGGVSAASPSGHSAMGVDARDGSSSGSANQTLFAESVFRTPAGAAFYSKSDDAYRSAAFDVPPHPGEYLLDTHGTPSSVEIVTDAGRVIELDAAQFAQVVRNNTDWAGQPIRLFSCDTAAESEGFAQELADRLGVQVTAPTTAVWSVSDGSTPIVSRPIKFFDTRFGAWRSKPAWPHDGEWRTFFPR